RSAQDRALSHREPARPMPVTKGLPLVGSIPRVREKGLLDVLMEDWKRHGDVFRLNLGRPTVAIAHPDAMERVLASHKENYVKGAAYDGVRAILGLGLVTLEGPAWRPRRLLLQPSFHRAGL